MGEIYRATRNMTRSLDGYSSIFTAQRVCMQRSVHHNVGVPFGLINPCKDSAYSRGELCTNAGNRGLLHGLYRVGLTYVYVSAGSATWGPKMRLLAPTEVTLITLRSRSD